MRKKRTKIKRITKDQKKAFELRCSGLSFGDIANALSISKSTAYSWVNSHQYKEYVDNKKKKIENRLKERSEVVQETQPVIIELDEEIRDKDEALSLIRTHEKILLNQLREWKSVAGSKHHELAQTILNLQRAKSEFIKSRKELVELRITKMVEKKINK